MKQTKAEHHAKKETKVEEQEAPKGTELETPATEEQPITSNLENAQKELAELQAKYDQLNDTYLRQLAEFDNYRKRTLKEKADLIKTGGESVLLNVLTVVDDLERGLAAMKETQDVEAVKQGMDLIYTKMQSFLKQNSVVAIETEGKDFNTDLHEAITTFPAPTEDLKGKVVDCVQKGYTLNEKVIRFAKVVVGE
jgi:molecular chaperone GrpE